MPPANSTLIKNGPLASFEDPSTPKQGDGAGRDHYATRAIDFFDSKREAALTLSRLPAEEEKEDAEPGRPQDPETSARNDAIEADYTLEGLTLAALGTKYGLNPSTVREMLLTRGVTLRRAGRPHKAAKSRSTHEGALLTCLLYALDHEDEPGTPQMVRLTAAIRAERDDRPYTDEGCKKFITRFRNA
jgi:hypothetical protein